MPARRSYADAVTFLNSLQTSFTVLEERRKQGLKMDDSAVHEMKQWISRSGHTIPELDNLNIVHVAGTKGKGSTCAFVNSILTYNHVANGIPRKIGLYTSPHLLAVRERIRINSEPISESSFAKYFFEVWDALETSAHQDGRNPNQKPNYFRFLTLMSFHVFIRERIDAAIYEVGIGGAWDSTNVIEVPAVTGVTTLGIDHVAVLGDTIEKIAWHKSGIFKANCPAYTVEQIPAAAEVLQQRAAEKGIQLQTVKIDPAMKGINIIPDADFQRQNASLAVALANTLLSRLGQSTFSLADGVPSVVKDGLEKSVWRGRCEIKDLGSKIWYLDGAHTENSLEVAARWFAEQTQKRQGLRVLIFNQQSRPEANELLRVLHHTLATVHDVRFDHVVFCTNVTRKLSGYRNAFINMNNDPKKVANLTVQKGFAELWTEISLPTDIHIMPTIEEGVELVEDLGSDNEVQVFVTGSFHLVGGVISILEGIQTPVSPVSPVSTG